jgi:hypothetical protein
MKRPFPQLFLITLFACIIRLPNIARDSLWMDESISYIAASLPLTLPPALQP